MTDAAARAAQAALVLSFFRDWIALADTAAVDQFRALLPAPPIAAPPALPAAPPGDGLPDMLSIAEAAAFLRIGRGLAYEASRDGRLPTVRVGRRRLVPKAALLASLGANTHERDT